MSIEWSAKFTQKRGFMVDEELMAGEVFTQFLSVSRYEREQIKSQKARVLWLTGLSGAGKSTVANAIDRCLTDMGYHCFLLDGDNVRQGLNKDLGFGDADRSENLRRVAEVAKLMADAGLIVIVSFISPFQSDRDYARRLLRAGEFIEVFIDTSLAVCEERDPKGLYRRARAGEIADFTGISSPYEAPIDPDIRLDTTAKAPEELARDVIAKLGLVCPKP
jgi:adenylyl-sulfate kinase